jgi:NTE family protein
MVRNTTQKSAKTSPGRCKWGLALGGGSVRGAAHVGVLAVLEREGIRPDVIAGTSAGAVVGAGYAAGVPAEELLRHFLAARWSRIGRPSLKSRLGMFDAHPLAKMVGRVTKARTFGDLEIPFAAVASDIRTGERVVLTEGELCEAVLASAAIPVMFQPVRRDGHLLVDGSITDNLPVGAARSLGADYVVAVDVFPPLDGASEPKNIRDVALISYYIVERERESGREHADLVITPDVGQLSLSDFSQVQRAYDAGVAAAEESLPVLLRSLRVWGVHDAS